MNLQTATKALIGALCTGLIVVIWLKPSLDNEHHTHYLQNLYAMDASMNLLSKDVVDVYLGLIPHYDFVEADLQELKKSLALVAYAPGFVGAEFDQRKQALQSGLNTRLSQLADNVNLIKQKVGLLRNSERSAAEVYATLRELSSNDLQLQSVLLDYQAMLDKDISAAGLELVIHSLRQNARLDPALVNNLQIHTAIVTRLKPDLRELVAATQSLAQTAVEPQQLADAYQQQAVSVIRQSDWYLYAATGIAVCLVSLTLLLLRLTKSAQHSLELRSEQLKSQNQLTVQAVSASNSVLAMAARGEFSARVEGEFQGQLTELQAGVNNTVDRIESTMQELERIMRALQQGNFKVTVSSAVSGSLRHYVEDMLGTLRRSFEETASVMESMRAGDFSQRIEVTASGDFDRLKQAVNGSMQALQLSLDEITEVVVKQSSGALDARVGIEAPGQLGILANAINDSSRKTSGVVDHISKVTQVVTDSSLTINNGNEDLSRRTEQTAQHLDQMTDTIMQITDGLDSIAGHTSEADSLATRSQDDAENGKNVVNEAVIAMQHISEASHKIASIIGVIDEIAFQTNLLALNASVEAARAGEQGKGFSVVAEEVGVLAGRSSVAAREIKALIEDSESKVARGEQLVQESGTTLEMVVGNIADMTRLIQDINNAAAIQRNRVRDTRGLVKDLQGLTQDNTVLARTVSQSGHETNTLMQQLQQNIRFFHHDENASDWLHKAS